MTREEAMKMIAELETPSLEQKHRAFQALQILKVMPIDINPAYVGGIMFEFDCDIADTEMIIT